MSDEDDNINAGDNPEGPAESSTSARNYEVGYGRPPKKNQFKLGNKVAAGKRGKRVNSIKADFLAELASVVPVTEGGKATRRTKQRLIARNAVHKAIKDGVAALKLTTMMVQLFEEEKVPEERPLSADEQAIFDSFFRRNGGSDDSSE